LFALIYPVISLTITFKQTSLNLSVVVVVVVELIKINFFMSYIKDQKHLTHTCHFNFHFPQAREAVGLSLTLSLQSSLSWAGCSHLNI